MRRRRNIRKTAPAPVIQPIVQGSDGREVRGDIGGLVTGGWEVVGEPAAGEERGGVRGDVGGSADGGDAVHNKMVEIEGKSGKRGEGEDAQRTPARCGRHESRALSRLDTAHSAFEKIIREFLAIDR